MLEQYVHVLLLFLMFRSSIAVSFVGRLHDANMVVAALMGLSGLKLNHSK